MNNTQLKIQTIVNALRSEYPSMSLESIIEDIEISIELLGINILYSDLSDLERNGNKVSGFARVNKNTGRPEIVINGNEPKFRRRFTMAHELGHIFLHWKWLPGRKIDHHLAEITYRADINYTQTEKAREWQANEFASELLLPLDEVKNLKSQYPNMSLMRNALADQYKVSPQVAKIQMEKANVV